MDLLGATTIRGCLTKVVLRHLVGEMIGYIARVALQSRCSSNFGDHWDLRLQELPLAAHVRAATTDVGMWRARPSAKEG